jgi:hypothetical protein
VYAAAIRAYIRHRPSILSSAAVRTRPGGRLISGTSFS